MVIKPVSLCVATCLHKTPGEAVELIKMLLFEIREIERDGFLEIVIFEVVCCVSLKQKHSVLSNCDTVRGF